jgi:FKBP-type peptidyl-prolyl cis-trans isomerase
MKKNLIIILFLAAVSSQAQVNLYRSGSFILRNETDSINYFLGLTLGYDLKSAPFEVDPRLISAGLNEAYAEEPLIDQQKAQLIVSKLRESLLAKEDEKMQLSSQENLEKGMTFLEKNGQREGVITTESGLQYEFVTKGTGPSPADTSTVNVHYEGSLIDGTTFDSSYERGEPISFPLNGVIKGWTEGLQLMPVGSTCKLYIPPALAYGTRSAGPIPPNSVLIFKIELLGIQ